MTKSLDAPTSNRGSTAQILCNVPLANPLVFDNLVASVDSLRIKFEYSKKDYDFENFKTFDTVIDILQRINSIGFWSENHVETETKESNFKLGRYQYTLTLRHESGSSLTLLAGRFTFDNSVKMVAPEIVLDVNPNKVPDSLWHKVARILFVKAHCVSLLRFDLAVDFPISRNVLHLLPNDKSRYSEIISADYQKIIKHNAITEYLGERSKHGAVKLYDKSYEIRKENSSISEFDCSRLEITIDAKKYKGLSPVLPVIYSDAPLQLSVDFENLDFCEKAIILHPDLIPILKKSVHRNTFLKYKRSIDMLRNNAISIDDSIICSIEQFVHGVLMQFNSKTGLQKVLYA